MISINLNGSLWSRQKNFKYYFKMIPILVESFRNFHLFHSNATKTQVIFQSEVHSKRVISPELLNAHAHDAKHVLLFATLRNCWDQSDPLRSLIILLVSQPMSSTALFAKSYTLAKQGDNQATDSENTFATQRKTRRRG